MGDAGAMFSDGSVYERMMGRWSRVAGEAFLAWLAPGRGLRWLDVGCGNGAFTETLIARTAPAAISGLDPSEGQIAYARTRTRLAMADLRVGDAQSLPYDDGTFDAAVMALVIAFVPDPGAAVAEMARVVKPGGSVSTYMWDVLAGGTPIEPLREALRAMGQDAPHPHTAAASGQDALRATWETAGLRRIEHTVLRISVSFASFEDFCASVIVPVGPLGAITSKLGPKQREALHAELRKQLPIAADGRITYASFANAIKGEVPR
ncbi:MAG TPA: class I SAM-dependent methyltransferase [Myxococcota bacterium]|nr:class I SAM-dependent methyltransferase [Myxococcota bacterium]